MSQLDFTSALITDDRPKTNTVTNAAKGTGTRPQLYGPREGPAIDNSLDAQLGIEEEQGNK